MADCHANATAPTTVTQMDHRQFVSDLTDVCEALRFVEPRSERGPKLEELLMKVKIPECGYLPLCRSTEPFQRVIKITPNEAKAFNTKVGGSVGGCAHGVYIFSCV